MTPGKVGETFEIFTTPPTDTKWWRWPKPTTNDFTAVPASSPRIYRTQRNNWGVSRVMGKRLTFGKGGKREVVRHIEGRIGEFWEKTSLFISDVIAKIFKR
jgi:hypothetical protein